LNAEDAIYSDRLGDYLPIAQAVEVRYGSRIRRGWYPSEYDDILYDEWSEEYIHIDDAIYSESYGYSILSDNAVSIVHEVDETGECNEDRYFIHEDDDREYVSFYRLKGTTWFDNIIKKCDSWGYQSGVEKSLLMKNSDGDFILSKFELEVYKISNPLSGMEYLTTIDAELFGVKVDETDNKITDDWTYTAELQDHKLVGRLRSEIQSLINSNQLEIDFGKDFRKSKDLDRYKKRLDQLETFLVL
jgi:hypothetical protein